MSFFQCQRHKLYIWKVIWIYNVGMKADAWLLFSCQRKIWLFDEIKFSSFCTWSWIWGLRESQYFLVLKLTHFFMTHESLPHPHPHLPTDFNTISSLSISVTQWWLPMTWGGRRREYSGHLLRSTSSALTSATRRGSTPPSRRTTAGLPNTMKPSLCE